MVIFLPPALVADGNLRANGIRRLGIQRPPVAGWRSPLQPVENLDEIVGTRKAARGRNFLDAPRSVPQQKKRLFDTSPVEVRRKGDATLTVEQPGEVGRSTAQLVRQRRHTQGGVSELRGQELPALGNSQVLPRGRFRFVLVIQQRGQERHQEAVDARLPMRAVRGENVVQISCHAAGRRSADAAIENDQEAPSRGGVQGQVHRDLPRRMYSQDHVPGARVRRRGEGAVGQAGRKQAGLAGAQQQSAGRKDKPRAARRLQKQLGKRVEMHLRLAQPQSICRGLAQHKGSALCAGQKAPQLGAAIGRMI